MLNIFYGRENIDKEKFIFEQLGKRALVMVPDQYTLEAEKQAFRHLGVSSLMDIEIISATSLGNNILKEIGGNRRNFINKYGRHMLLYKSARERREDLKVFRGVETKSSFLDAVNNFISEMKQYDCGSDDLKEMSLRFKTDSYTSGKLQDIYILFSEYEKQIKGKYTDSEDYIDLYLEKIKESSLVCGNSIWVYGFDSFAPKTMALLGQLMTYAGDVNLVLTWDDKRSDRDLFELTGMVMENAEKLAKSLGVSHKRFKIPDTYERSDKIKAVRHIERELYTLPSAKSFHNEGLTLTEAAGIYNEAESAAAYVLHLVRDKGLRYRDIRLVCNDLEGRGAIIQKVFEEYGIELFSDTKRDIMANPVVKHILSLIDVVIENYRSDKVLAMLKSGFGDLKYDEVADLENYAIKYKIKGNMWKKPFRRGKEEYGEEGLKHINELRKKALASVIVLEEVFKSQTTGEFIESFYNYLCTELKLRDRILDFIAKQEQKNFFELAEETAHIWESIADILNQMYEIMGEESFDAEMFRDIFVTGLGQVEIGLLPPTEDGLVLGNIQRSRSGRIKALVVIGANEGILPQEKPTQGLFSAEERELFRNDGKELCKVDSIRFMEERLAIYRTLSSPSEYMWISYSLTDEAGGQIRPSRIFLKIKELFPEAEVSRDLINGDDDGLLINSMLSGRRHISRKILAAGEGEGVEHRWKSAIGWLQQNHPEDIGEIRNSIAFTNRQEALGREASSALFNKNPYKALSLSPSRVERYARCPFSHLVSYGFRPEERRVFEAAPREIGDIYHRCLMALTEKLTEDGVPVTSSKSHWMTLTKEECCEMVEKEIEQITVLYREGLFNSGNLEEYRQKRIVKICSQVCWTVVEQVRAGKIDRIEPEISFGRNGKLPPLEVDIDGEKVYIEGIIDRVDFLQNGRIKIVDYKTGRETFDVKEAAAGYRLQLMTYLEAACGEKGKPAGVFYFKIKEPSVDFSGREVDEETLQKEVRKSFKLDGIMVEEPEVIEDIVGNFEGYSEIVPIRATADGIRNTGKNGLMAEEEFAELQSAAADRIRQACIDLAKGKIDIHPMKTEETSACAFCRYKGICRFDTVFEGCSFNII